jgi:membrane-associated phospholipid phosphatase
MIRLKSIPVIMTTSGRMNRTDQTMTLVAPGPSIEGYQVVVDLVQGAPAWVRTAIAICGPVLLVGSTLVFIALIWRARGGGTRVMALAVLAPVATTVAYLVNEVTKELVAEERPCRTLGNTTTISACPVAGDWSFPSNHAVVAGAVAVAVLIAWRRLAAVVVPLALLGALSRVAVGVHYPHDVIAGCLIGAVVTSLVMLTGAHLVTTATRRRQAQSVVPGS